MPVWLQFVRLALQRDELDRFRSKVQVAVSILRLRSPRTEALREWATGIAARRGKKIAIVALARRMTGVLFAMMRDRTCYFQAALPEPSAAQVA